MSGHKPWSEIKRKRERSRMSRFLDALKEFFNPRDWIPTFPSPRKKR